ncbi:hypothetical protein QZH41_016558, partial [Actinostola sp. cb2023]
KKWLPVSTTLLYSTLLYSTLLYSTLLYSTLLYSTLLYSTLLYSTLLYSTLLYSTLLYSTLLYSTLLYSTLLYSTLLYSTLLYSTLLYSTLLYSTLLYSTLLCYAILYYHTLLYSAILCCTLDYSTLLYSTLLYSTLLYSTLLYSTLLYSTLLYSTLLYSTLLYSTLHYTTLLYSTLLYSTLIYSTLLYYILYYAILYYTLLFHSYFGLQHYGECWSGKDADLTYARDGSSDACVKGVGKEGANFVYKLLNSLDHSCDLGWHSTKYTCFRIATNVTITRVVQANDYCSKYHGLFHLAKSAQNFLTQDRLIKTLHLNKQLNDTDCLVLSDAGVTYTGVLAPWNGSALAGGHTGSSLGSSYKCGVKDVNGKWYHNKCDLKNCKILCSRHRDVQPSNGTFTMVRTNAIFVNNLLRWQIVDDVKQCARECLVTDACNSFNFEYSSRSQVVGSLCGLNKYKMADSVGDLKESFEYHYFERLR